MIKPKPSIGCTDKGNRTQSIRTPFKTLPTPGACRNNRRIEYLLDLIVVRTVGKKWRPPESLGPKLLVHVHSFADNS